MSSATQTRLSTMLHPEVQTLWATHRTVTMNHLGLTLILVGTYRSLEEQERLWAQGRSMPGPIVTKLRFGWHNLRRAYDAVPLDPKTGALNWKGPWDEIGAIAEELGLTWGGRFKGFPDLDHFEYHPGLTLAAARAQAGL